ncbi:MAG: ABC transporter substrate-binding protein [Betaproteobacteria bacterium]
MKSRLAFLFLCILIGSLASMSLAAHAKSGEVVVYAALIDKDIAPMQEAFKRDTGLDLKAVVISIGQATTRIKAENGAPQADVLVGGSIQFHDELARNGLLVPYESPNSKVIDARFKDEQHRWTGYYIGILGLVINEAAFKKELPGVALPQTWDDLLDPAYKGKYVHANPATSGAASAFIANQIFRFGDEGKAWDYLAKFTKNVAQYQSSSAGPTNLVATGEYPIGLAWVHDAVMKADSGYPLKVIVPRDTAYEVGGVSILKGAENLENAKIFVDWVLSQKEGSRSTEFSHRYSTRPDVKPPKNMPPLSSVKLVKYDFDWVTKNQDRLAKRFAELMNK